MSTRPDGNDTVSQAFGTGNKNIDIVLVELLCVNSTLSFYMSLKIKDITNAGF